MSTGARRDTLVLLAAPALGCAILTVALVLMDANRAPWWAQVGTGLAVVLSAVVLGVQIERVQWRRDQQATGGRRQATETRQRPLRAGGSMRDGADPVDVYWTERAPKPLTQEKEDHEA